MQKRAACFGKTKSSSNRGENQSLDHSQSLPMSGHEVHFLIRERIAIFEVRRWIAVNCPAPYGRNCFFSPTYESQIFNRSQRYMTALVECAGPATCW